jgi:hypothetical protein
MISSFLLLRYARNADVPVGTAEAETSFPKTFWRVYAAYAKKICEICAIFNSALNKFSFSLPASDFLIEAHSQSANSK